ncbi:MAG: hypothetical protein AVDCRST_MAG22-3699, partial [uncultured Rubrobacteraceae bacterium]
AGETRATTGAPRTVHGQRDGGLAGPDGVPPLRGGAPAGGPGGKGARRDGLRRHLQQPARAGLRDRRDHRAGVRLLWRSRAGARPDRTPRRRPRGALVGRAGGAQPRVRPQVPHPARGGALGVRRRRDRRAGHGPLRGRAGQDTLPPPRRRPHRRRLSRGLDARLPQGPLRARRASRNPQGRERLHHTHCLGPQRHGPRPSLPRLHRAPHGPERPRHDQGRV